MAVLSRDLNEVPEPTATPMPTGMALELTIAAGVITILGALSLGGHVLHGGLYTDDWPITEIYARGGTSSLIHQLILGDHSRPLAAIYLALAQAASGTDAHAHDAIGLAVHLLACWSLYWFLRTVTLTRWEAGAITGLALLFPFSDSSWLWFAVTQSTLSLCFMLLGLVAMMYGVRACGRRSVALHLVATLLIVGSVLLYETSTAVAIVAAAAVQLTHTPWRTALLRTLGVIAAVVAALVIPRIHGVLPGSDPHQGLPQHEQIHHARLMADQSFTILTGSAVPFGAAHRNIVVPILGLIFLAGLAGWIRATKPSQRRSQLQRWLCCVVAGAAVVAASYVVFVDTDFSYQPAFPGAANRINVVAAVGYCLVVYGEAMLLALLITGLTRVRPVATVAIASVVALVLALGYANRSRDDVHTWDRAASIQRQELAALSETLGRPAPGTTIFAFGGVGQVAPNVYAFGVTWDLNTAIKLRWDDPTLQAYSIFSGTTFLCTATTVTPAGFWNSAGGLPPTIPYGQVVFLDFRTGRHTVVHSERECLRARSEFQPGPLVQNT